MRSCCAPLGLAAAPITGLAELDQQGILLLGRIFNVQADENLDGEEGLDSKYRAWEGRFPRGACDFEPTTEGFSDRKPHRSAQQLAQMLRETNRSQKTQILRKTSHQRMRKNLSKKKWRLIAMKLSCGCKTSNVHPNLRGQFSHIPTSFPPAGILTPRSTTRSIDGCPLVSIFLIAARARASQAAHWTICIPCEPIGGCSWTQSIPGRQKPRISTPCEFRRGSGRNRLESKTPCSSRWKTQPAVCSCWRNLPRRPRLWATLRQPRNACVPPSSVTRKGKSIQKRPAESPTELSTSDRPADPRAAAAASGGVATRIRSIALYGCRLHNSRVCFWIKCPRFASRYSSGTVTDRPLTNSRPTIHPYPNCSALVAGLSHCLRSLANANDNRALR